MASKRRINYQWQLFLPLIITLWALIIGMAFWQSYNEREYRIATLNSQLELVNKRIISYYEKDKNPLEFFNFINDYYIVNPIYDRIRISVYKDGKLIHNIGEIIDIYGDGNTASTGVTSSPSTGITTESNSEKSLAENNFFYRTGFSSDGRLRVSTVLPFNANIVSASLPKASIWTTVIILGIILTLLSYYSTRYFGKNIRILRSIADKAASDPNFIPPMDYPHDELGDITRQITIMYNEKSKAVLRLKREHDIAIHAMEEKARLKRQLTNNINHELKTPIGVIKGYLDTIVANPDMDEQSRNHFIAKAVEHTNRLVNLISDISAITRLDEGSALINTEELDYHEVVYTVMNDLEESGALGSMEFTYDIPPKTMILGNYSLLTGMLINLAKNSAAYSKGTVCGVRLEDEDDNFYTLVFYDNGIGAGEEHIPHLFERFYRVDSGRMRANGGTGLGLPIVQNVVTAHGGTIKVRNGEKCGLEFIYTLPKSHNK